MCDECEDERMVAFWRRLEEIDPHEQLAARPETKSHTLVTAAPPPASAKPRPQGLQR